MLMFYGKVEYRMKFIVKLFPEIIMKSDSVRRRFVKILSHNIKAVLCHVDEQVLVIRHWDFIEVRSSDEKKLLIRDTLQRISGIHHFLEVDEKPYHNLHDIFEHTYLEYKDKLINKSFCVRVKRRGKTEFNSMDAMRYIGGGLNQSIDSASVKLKNPDITIHIEIDHDHMMIVKGRFEGLGGYPMSTQEDVLSLISGGFDSGVASHMFMRRGSRVHYCFFNLGGQAHELGVKQMAYHLWSRYSLSHKVWFITVDFEPVVAEILKTIDDGHMGVVLKRMMVKAASQIAQQIKIQALVTGEAMGQVASQTLTNLNAIYAASSTLILRPLITSDKEDIIKMAEKIGTANIAKSMPEYCGVISKSPTVKALKSKILEQEANFNFEILNYAIQTAKFSDIRDLNIHEKIVTAEVVQHITSQQVVLDIRMPDEVDDKPLKVDAAVITLPFYKLLSEFDQLDPTKTYLLYCQQGVMSRLQAAQLLAKGHHNVKIFKPSSPQSGL